MSLKFIVLLTGCWSDIMGHWWKGNEYIDWDWLIKKRSTVILIKKNNLELI